MNAFVLILIACFSKTIFASSLTLTPGGLGVHSLRPQPKELRELMPRKIDGSGHLVITPGAGAVYRWKEQLLGGIFLQDSFSNMAFSGVYGQQWPTGKKDVSWGWVGGLYIRKSMTGCHPYNYQILCISDSKDLPVKLSLGGGSAKTDLAPIFGLQLNYAPKVSQNLRLDINFVTAFYISLVTIGLRFDWAESTSVVEEGALEPQP